MNEPLHENRFARTTNGSVRAQRHWIRPQDLQEASQPLEKLIMQHPALAIGSSFLIGVAVAWWLKRR
jgi:hypothetical protein